mmetsp:Transcript_117655/g.279339  ORF Transcript_117655/g.279339 Transcript_117655/m.279339 type:complete len:251 (-) Transcript_117655:279-1031(-)
MAVVVKQDLHQSQVSVLRSKVKGGLPSHVSSLEVKRPLGAGGKEEGEDVGTRAGCMHAFAHDVQQRVLVVVAHPPEDGQPVLRQVAHDHPEEVLVAHEVRAQEDVVIFFVLQDFRYKLLDPCFRQKVREALLWPLLQELVEDIDERLWSFTNRLCEVQGLERMELLPRKVGVLALLRDSLHFWPRSCSQLRYRSSARVGRSLWRSRPGAFLCGTFDSFSDFLDGIFFLILYPESLQQLVRVPRSCRGIPR